MQVDTEPYPVDFLTVSVAQRYSVLVTARNDTSQNWLVHANFDDSMFDTVPEGLTLSASRRAFAAQTAPGGVLTAELTPFWSAQTTPRPFRTARVTRLLRRAIVTSSASWRTTSWSPSSPRSSTFRPRSSSSTSTLTVSPLLAPRQ